MLSEGAPGLQVFSSETHSLLEPHPEDVLLGCAVIEMS